MFRQCMLKDLENECYLGGIAYYEVDENDNETLQYVICGCCGAQIDAEDIVQYDHPVGDCEFKLVSVYNEWADLTDTIYYNHDKEFKDFNERED